MTDRVQDRKLNDTPLISIVIPLYNEENNVQPLVERLAAVLNRAECSWELVFALDPSPDRTQQKIRELMDANYPIRLVIFSRRIGKPLSVLAGLDHCRGDACIIIDADLQDPPELMEQMIEKWRQGFEVVIPQRVSRKGENFFYLRAADMFYWLLGNIAEVEVPKNTGDFRLMDARVVREVCRFRERHGFLRGIVASAGFRTAIIAYYREPRFAGRTQISLAGAFNIALDGIVPFSRIPVRTILALGLILLLLGGGSALIWLLCSIFRGFSHLAPFIALAILGMLLSGIVVTSMGIIGEYLVRAYEEIRRRPLYIVDKIEETASLPRKISPVISPADNT
jgi:glycosyltransferase involved in cell wall biosynthesis